MPHKIALSVLVRPVIVLTRPLITWAQRLRKERKAADGKIIESDMLDETLEQTLSRLENISANDVWYSKILQALGTAYVRPDYLAKPSIRSWLQEPLVRKNLKKLARAQLVQSPVDQSETRKSLAKRYSFYTFEAEQLATGPIESVINILTAGAKASTKEEGLLVVGVVQESSNQILEKLDAMAETIQGQPDAITIKAHTLECEKVLERILKRRSLPGVDACDELVSLAGRVDTHGDLCRCSQDVRTKVLLWTTRMLASNKSKASNIAVYRQKLFELDPNADTTVIDAWTDAANGKPDEGLRRLQTKKGADFHTTIMAILITSYDSTRALAWFDEQGAVDNGFLTPIGWRNLAVALAEAGRWNEGINYLAQLNVEQFEAFPDLHYVNGVLNAAQLLPEGMRHHALNMQIFEKAFNALEGAAVKPYSARALTAFASSADAMEKLGELHRAAVAEQWRVWLLLTDSSTHQNGRDIVQAAMLEGSKAVGYVELAYAFGIKFDAKYLEKHLRMRELAGGLSHSEISAKLTLYRHTRPPSEILKFLADEEETLKAVLPETGRAFLIVTSLIAAGQLEQAEVALERYSALFEEDLPRLRDQIRVRRGEDVSQSFENRFKETNSDIDLHNLCLNLQSTKDMDRLRRYILLLFERQPNLLNAGRVAEVLQKIGQEQELADFLEKISTLEIIDDDLRSLMAWTLMHRGRINEAAKINNDLLQKRDHPNDASLEMNLVLYMGAWDRFSQILEREWGKRSDRAPRYLLQLARLAADTDKERSLKILKEAALKGKEDANILSASAALAYHLGHDDLALPWMVAAAKLSSPEGPVRTADTKEALEIMSASADRTRGIVEAFLSAKIPLHMAASFLNQPITNFLITRRLENINENDARQKSNIPLRHGARLTVDASKAQTILTDFTSLLILAEMGLLETFGKRFSRIFVPWSLMELLLVEHHSCRYHQPSRIESAKKLRDLIVDKVLEPFNEYVEPPLALVKEIGKDLADLVVLAQQKNSRVVRSLPIYKLGSFMEVSAELGEFEQTILTVHQFIGVLEREAVIDKQAINTAEQFLSSVDVGSSLGSNEVGNAPIYIDDLTISLLESANLLDYLRRSKRKFVIHPNAVAEATQLIASERYTSGSLEILEALRHWLCSGISAGAICIMPRVPLDEEKNGPGIRVIQEVLSDVGNCDAVLIDDRLAGMHPQMQDKNGKTKPMLDTFDVLNELTRSGFLTKAAQWNQLHRLREQAVMCVPLSLEELITYINKQSIDPTTGKLIESAELRALRENFQGLRATTILQQPAETDYLDRVRGIAILAIREIWLNKQTSIPLAIARSEWIWEYVVPSPTDWAHTITDPTQVLPTATGLANQITWLLAIFMDDTSRRHAFCEWVEATILSPLELASRNVLDTVAGNIQARVPVWIADAED